MSAPDESPVWLKYAMALPSLLMLPMFSPMLERERRFRDWEEAQADAKAAHIRYLLAEGRTAHAVREMIHGLGTPEWRASVLAGLAK